MAKVYFVLGFPGIGKTVTSKKLQDHPLYSLREYSTREWDKTEFPRNYVDNLLNELEQAHTSNKKVVLIMGSAHKTVRAELDRRHIPFILIYPSRECKEEYEERYKGRDNSESFVDKHISLWDEKITQMEEQQASQKIVLKPGQYLEDVLPMFGFDFIP